MRCRESDHAAGRAASSASARYPEVRDIPELSTTSRRASAPRTTCSATARRRSKASWGRYLMGLGGGDARDASPAVTVFSTTDRASGPTPTATSSRTATCATCSRTASAARWRTSASAAPRRPRRGRTTARTGWGVREYNYQTTPWRCSTSCGPASASRSATIAPTGGTSRPSSTTR